MYIDTHCHLPLLTHHIRAPLCTEPLQEHVMQALRAEVTLLVTVATSLNDSHICVEYAAMSPHIYATIGVHPTESLMPYATEAKLLSDILTTHPKADRIIAIGECGIDLYRTTLPLINQQNRFRAQIELALKFNRALIIHSRSAAEETLTCLDEYAHEPLRAIMHCFSYDLPIAKELSNRNILLGIGGTLTYPNNKKLQEIVQTIPLECCVLETDAPFLAPQKHRGKPNHPSFIPIIAEHMAKIKNIDISTIAHATTENAKKIFGLQ